MKVNILLLSVIFLLIGCGIQHEHKGIPKVPDQVNVEVTHKIDFDGIEAFCELQSIEVQACIDNLTSIFVQILDSSQDSDTQTSTSD